MERKTIDARNRMIICYFDLEDELYAQSTWSGRETAVSYLEDLYKENRKTMKFFNIDTDDLDKKYEKGKEALNKVNTGNYLFNDFKILDDAFLDSMDKACRLIYEKLNPSREEAIEVLKRQPK